MPSRISTDQLLLAFTGCHVRPVYDMDNGFELSFWGEQNEPKWQDLGISGSATSQTINIFGSRSH